MWARVPRVSIDSTSGPRFASNAAILQFNRCRLNWQIAVLGITEWDPNAEGSRCSSKDMKTSNSFLLVGIVGTRPNYKPRNSLNLLVDCLEITELGARRHRPVLCQTPSCE